MPGCTSSMGCGCCALRATTAARTRGATIRIHQEDICQARGVAPESKYEEAGGPRLSQCAELLDEWARGRADLEHLLDLVVLNVVIGNADAHAKNLSLLHTPDGRVELAPAYDLMSTTHYPQVSTTAGMSIGGARDIAQVTRADIVREARGWGLPAQPVEERISRLLERSPGAAERAAADIEPPAGLSESVVLRAEQLQG